MSGGIDSTAAAVILEKSGYDVTGFTFGIDFFDSDPAVRAKKICDKLGMPHIYQNISGKFKNEVIEYFRKEYENGRTPNPCIKCNLNIKFGYIYEYAMDSGYDYVATGHYASIREIDGKKRLSKALDPSRDQTYFLYVLKEEQLDRILFPLADVDKAEARAICGQNGLLPEDSKESREICFISDNYKRFLNEELGARNKPGNFVDTEGNIIARHEGIINYTVGQRKGLGIELGKPVYIKSIESATGDIVLSDKEELYTDSFDIAELNLINGIIPKNEPLYVKIRYGAPYVRIAGMTDKGGGVMQITSEKPLKAVTPGQSAVICTDSYIVGGGAIIA